MTMLRLNEADINIELLSTGKNLVTVVPKDQTLFVPRKSFETIYRVELIEKILSIKGSAYLCDELVREEDPRYVRRDLEVDLKSYLNFTDFAGKRILDFGCGSGASTMILARMFPASEIVGVELDKELLSIAQARHKFYGYENISLYLSPSGCELPPEIGQFDLVIMSAVYEHLLPSERETVMPLVWGKIKNQGALFLNMTPHRYFPVEHHTTGLPFINYLPDSITYSITRKFSRRIDPSEPWEILLRRGIRGGTEQEIVKILGLKSKDNLVEPQGENIKDRIDLWYSQLNQNRMPLVKKTIKTTLKLIKALTGQTLVPNLSLLIQKK